MRSPAYFALAGGVIAVSTAAVLIREADAPALVIAAYRLGLAAIPAGVGAAVLAPRYPFQVRSLRWPLLAGVFLALHFGFWIASLQQTSIVTSVVLVTTDPLFVGLASPFLLKERVARTTWLGIAVSAAGASVTALDDVAEGMGTLVGDLYALLAAFFGATYLLIGRKARREVPWIGYIGSTYTASAVLLAAAVIVAGQSFTGYSTKTFVMFGLLALVPQLIGHSAINWSLGYLPAALVAVAILGEPVGATALAAVVLGDRPSALEAVGSALILTGVYIATRPAREAAVMASMGEPVT